jgi:hypothetical protein
METANEFDKSVTLITDEKEYHAWRLKIAAAMGQGLLASQDKEGWNLARLAFVSLQAADAMLEIASKPLPKPTTRPRQDDMSPIELQVLDENGGVSEGRSSD